VFFGDTQVVLYTSEMLHVGSAGSLDAAAYTAALVGFSDCSTVPANSTAADPTTAGLYDDRRCVRRLSSAQETICAGAARAWRRCIVYYSLPSVSGHGGVGSSHGQLTKTEF